MAGITRLTALEIFTQPDDLEFRVGQDGDKWRSQLLAGQDTVSSFCLKADPVFDSSDAAISAIGDVLEIICTKMTAELSVPSSLAAQVVNPDNRPIDDANALSGDYRERIISDLTDNGVASTYIYKNPV